ncbi:MAG: calcium/sodium antiporter [Clostridiales bacterium]|nr:calcium/sodium antiporter [Clostridiales bacterium]
MIFLQILLLLVGFVLLVKGADWFIDGAAGIAAKLKVSTFVIGLTIVALGTSAPEAATSIVGAIKGEGDIIIGNVLGSNIINILLILGICSFFAQIPIEKSSKLIELPFLIIVSALFILLGVIGSTFVWWEGLILLGLYGAFMAYTIVMATKSKSALIEDAVPQSIEQEAIVEVYDSKIKAFFAKASNKYEELKQKVWFLIILTIVGLALVVLGADFVVDSATYIAGKMGIPDMVIGLTVVAFGTSLPELVTSVSAAKKGDMGIATGNIIGSNLSNLLFVGGLGFIASGGVAINVDVTTFVIDTVVSILATLILWFFAFGKKQSLTKASGVIMIGVLAVYYVYLFLMAFGVIVL